MNRPSDLENARRCYERMSTAHLVELRECFEADAKRSPITAEHCRPRLELIAELIAARVN